MLAAITQVEANRIVSGAEQPQDKLGDAESQKTEAQWRKSNSRGTATRATARSWNFNTSTMSLGGRTHTRGGFAQMLMTSSTPSRGGTVEKEDLIPLTAFVAQRENTRSVDPAATLPLHSLHS